MPFKSEKLLYISLLQFPQLWKSPNLIKIDYDEKNRFKISLNYEKYEGIEREIRRLVNKLMPICYLEGYEILRKQALDHYPTNPKFIFTSNNFYSDEIFKVWTAEKINEGVPYYRSTWKTIGPTFIVNHGQK